VRVLRSLQASSSPSDIVFDSSNPVATDLVAPSVVRAPLPIDLCPRLLAQVALIRMIRVGLNRVHDLLLSLNRKRSRDQVVKVRSRIVRCWPRLILSGVCLSEDLLQDLLVVL
jgi:hypothetical protein